MWQGPSVPAVLKTRYGRTDLVSEVAFHSLICRLGLASHLLKGCAPAWNGTSLVCFCEPSLSSAALGGLVPLLALPGAWGCLPGLTEP